ncbi:toll/interleukin-1 receptor domain-containing protein [Mariniblastus sp.]|nr:toll/interleukin-1 receptor domain-containing protein [Mariniblastus sp.]
MATVWITYAWTDNESGDIDFVAKELSDAGLAVKLDRWNIQAGKRLWDQLSNFITNEAESDAWLMVATNNSLQSEPCKEEYAYALDRALSVRGANFPVIALFQGSVDKSLIPAGIKTRLYVSLTDPDWKERIVAAAEGRGHSIDRPDIPPFFLHVHRLTPRLAIEVRPRAGTWAPFLAAVPFNEKDIVNPSLMIGPRDVPTNSGALIGGETERHGDNWVVASGNQATPTQSFYIWCDRLPTQLTFGVDGGSPQYTVNLSKPV